MSRMTLVPKQDHMSRNCRAIRRVRSGLEPAGWYIHTHRETGTGYYTTYSTRSFIHCSQYQHWITTDHITSLYSDTDRGRLRWRTDDDNDDDDDDGKQYCGCCCIHNDNINNSSNTSSHNNSHNCRHDENLLEILVSSHRHWEVKLTEMKTML